MAQVNGELGVNRTRVWLTLDVSTPQREGDEWIFIVSGRCELARHEPYSGAALELFVNAEKLDAEIETDPDGNFRHDVRRNKPGEYKFEAGFKETTLRATERRRVTIDKPATKVAYSLKVIPIGRPGEQKLLISVADETGRLIPKYPGKIVDGDTVNSFETEADGTYIYLMNFLEPERLAEVHVGNDATLVWTAVLVGP